MSGSLRLLSGAAAVLLLVGCAVRGAPDVPEAGTATATAEAVIEAMEPSEKRSSVATDFPVEVPVPTGEVLDSQAQGADAWTYTLAVPAQQEDIVRWYREAYAGRSWFVVREGHFDGLDGGGVFLDLRKGDAESSVSVFGQQIDGRTRVSVTLGLGTPVLQTQ